MCKSGNATKSTQKLHLYLILLQRRTVVRTGAGFSVDLFLSVSSVTRGV